MEVISVSLMRSDVMFKVDGAKCVERQKVKLRPIERHYEKENESEKIKYSCQLCESLSREYPNKVLDEDNQFKNFSFPKGTPQCPCCGINIDWDYKKVIEWQLNWARIGNARIINMKV